MSNEIIQFNNQNTKIEQLFQSLPVNTQTAYKTAINQFLDYFNINVSQIGQISSSDILSYIKHMEAQYSASTINVKIASLKTLYNRLSILMKISNPFAELKQMKIKTTLKTNKIISKTDVLSENDIEKLFDYLKNNPSFTNNRNYILLKLLYETGLRISEALSIKFENIKMGNSGIHSIKIIGKGKKVRQVYILSDLYDLIDKHCSSGYIFKSSCENQLHRKVIHIAIKRLGRKILKKDISAHTFRHSHITSMIQKHPDKIRAVSNYVGHASVSTTLQMYMHDEILPSDIQKIAIT